MLLSIAIIASRIGYCKILQIKLLRVATVSHLSSYWTPWKVGSGVSDAELQRRLNQEAGPDPHSMVYRRQRHGLGQVGQLQ